MDPLVGLKEKPIQANHINAGIYCLDPNIFSYLEKAKSMDMTILFEKVRSLGRRTIAYPMHEPWIDVGRPEDYEMAENHFETAS